MPADRAALNGQWIEPVVDRWERPLVLYALFITGDLEQARDVVQDTFLSLCKEQEQGKSLPEHLAAWLYKVCRNRAFDVRKKENRMKLLGEERLRTIPSFDPALPRTAEDRESMNRIKGLLDELPDNQQDVVRLRFEHELSYRQISEVTGLTVTNVGYLLHMAIKTLRLEMGVGG